MLQVLDWKAADRDSLWNKVRRKVRHWRHMLAFFGDLYANERPGSRVTPDMHPLIRSKKRLYQLAVPPVFAVLGPLLGPVSRAPVEEAEHAAAEAEVHYLRPAEMGRRIIAALQRALWQPDFVFNMYMDMFKTGPVAWGRYDSICRLPWGGIRFVPSAPPYEAYYASPSFRGMCFLDEAACEDYSRRYPGKHFQYLPDITETSLPAKPGTLARKINQRAAGRKIVFLGGTIGGQKNLARWYDAIARADPDRWFFVQIGELVKGMWSAEDALAFDRIMSQTPDNVLIEPTYLPDERVFNEIIVTSDILFAVYRDFRISSNMPCKAASFRKPILVSDRYVMGERVTRYGIGLAVPEDDTAKILEGLERLVREPIPAENFMNFCRDFSEEATARRLDDFLDRCLRDRPLDAVA